MQGKGSMEKDLNNYKLAFFTLLFTACTGILIHSVGVYLTNIRFPLSEFNNTAGVFIEEDYYTRLDRIIMFENICKTFDNFFEMVAIIFLAKFVWVKKFMAFKKLALYYFLFLFMVVACAVPFEFLDKEVYGRYLYPIWSILIFSTICFVLVCIFNCRAYIYEKKAKSS